MDDQSKVSDGAAALAAARLRAWRTALLALHKVLVDAELVRYGAAHGPVTGPHHALKLLSEDAWFQWLRPFVVLVVEIDERLADRRPVGHDEVEAFRRAARRLLQPAADDPDGREYRRSLQELPDAVAQHGLLIELTKDDPA